MKTNKHLLTASHAVLGLYNDKTLDMDDKFLLTATINNLVELLEDCLVTEASQQEFKHEVMLILDHTKCD